MMHYERMGTGFPLVLLHGFTGSNADWAHHQKSWSSHHDVIAIDLPGHGKTPWSNDMTSMADVADGFVALLDELGLNKINLLGYSMGGRLALYIAVHYPNKINKLILESTSPGLKTEQERISRRKHDEQLATRIKKDGIRAFIDFWEQISLWESQRSLSDKARQSLREQRLKNNAHGLASSLRYMGTGHQPSLWEHLTNISCPIMLITGKLDEKFTNIAKEMQQRLPKILIATVPDAGHNIHLEQSNLFKDLIFEFLA